MFAETCIVCPFFIRASEVALTCEGIVDRTEQRMKFEAGKECRRHRMIYCQTFRYKECEHARRMLEKHGAQY